MRILIKTYGSKVNEVLMAHLKQVNWGGRPPVNRGGRRAHERVHVRARDTGAQALIDYG